MIAVAAVGTAMLSAVAGLGGGIILLTVLAQFFAPVVAIPIQGGIQLVSNGSRAALLRRQVNWSAVWRGSILLLPASLLGVLVATSIPVDATRLLLGLFVLVLAWRPSMLKSSRAGTLSDSALVGVGGVSGFLNTTVGASGPVTSPFFKAVTASHAAFVATAASAQVLAHLSKLVAFGLDGFDFVDHLEVIAVGAVGVVVGTRIGTRLVGRADEAFLTALFKVVLTALAVRLVLRSVV